MQAGICFLACVFFEKKPGIDIAFSYQRRNPSFTFTVYFSSLRLSAITGVTTSQVARKQGLERKLTAQLITEDAAEDGEYVITLGPESHAAVGSSKYLPTLSASVGAFTRMWLGVRPASGLAVTDELSGPETLLKDLDELITLPTAHLGWEF